MKNHIIFLKDNKKYFCSEDYNYIFNLENGEFVRFGKNEDDDPTYSEFGPELLDIEISTMCSGIPQGKGKTEPIPCKHCYKSNTKIGSNMSFDTFQKIFSVIPKTVCQIAFGIGDIDSNSDFFKMMEFCRENKVIPNYTTNGFKVTDEISERTVRTCGAVAVSSYVQNKDICYDAVQKFSDVNKKLNGKLQINIHCLLSKETLNFCYEVARDSKSDKRLENLNAIVFLQLKECGRGKSYKQISAQEYSTFLDFLLENEIRFGHDSCSYPNLIFFSKDSMKENIRLVAEGCESSRFSLYINVEGKAFPCSFAESKYNGTSVVDCKSFIDDVWNNTEISSFRESLINSTKICKCEEKNKTCMKCPIYDVALCCL
jgi:hypothetical protein